MKKTISMSFLFFVLFLILTSGFTASYPPAKLQIVCPAQVYEDSVFFVTVKSGVLFMDNATVMFNGDTNQTNATGVAGFRAPFVIPQENTTLTITVLKEGYQSGNSSIHILNIPQLFPMVTSSVMTGNTSFVVTVLTEDGTPVENVTITYDHRNYTTDMNGVVTLITPFVPQTKTMVLSVQKTGYLSNTLSLTISPPPTQENILGVLLILGICAVIVVASLALVVFNYLKARKINRK
jgi:hypothetical protein